MYFSLRDLHRSMMDAGIAPHLHAMVAPAATSVLAEWAPVPVTVHGGGHGGVRRLARRLHDDAPDVIHLHGLWSPLSILTRLQPRRTPLLISPHGMLDAWALRQKRVKKAIGLNLLERANLNRASCIVALNDTEAQGIRAIGVTAPIAIIPHGVHIPASRPGLPAPETIASYGEYILFLGRIDPKKGLSLLMEALAVLKEMNPALGRQYKLVVAGWNGNPYGNSLREHIRQRNLENNVVFTGAVFGATKAALFSHAKAFILPSFSEGLPMAALEAMSHGVPAFISRQCNMPHSFARRAAIEIALEPHAIAATLATHLRDDALLEEVGAAGLQYVLERHHWPDVARRYRALYGWLLEQADRPDYVF